MSVAGNTEHGEVTGVCHVTAATRPGTDVSSLVVRFVMTHDVESSASVTRHAVGPDEACRELRSWMGTMCAPRTEPLEPSQ